MMQLELPKHPYYRPRPTWWRWLVLLALLAGGGYFAFEMFGSHLADAVVQSTAMPTPTPTPSVGFYIAEAEDAYLMGATGAAIAAYQRALDVQPNQAELYVTLARLLVIHGRPERGLAMAREALKRQPESARAWAALCMAYDWLRVPTEAVRACRRAVELDPTLPEAYAYLAEALIDSGQWWDADAAIARALELGPNNVDVLRSQGYVLENQGSYSRAIEVYRQALEISGMHIHIHMGIGRNAMALGNLQAALRAYTDAVEADPTHAIALNQKGWIQLLLGDYDNARINLRAAIEMDPTLGTAYGHLGTLYFQQRNYEDAIDLFVPGIRYAEARSRRRTVYVTVTLEDTAAVGDAPAGPEVARASLVHPEPFDAPMRGEFEGGGAGPDVRGRIRFDPMTGRYEIALSGVPPAPQGKVYVAWFVPLRTPERATFRTPPIFPAADGRATLSDVTGPVAGASIENYYILALSYYLLGRCSEATPYIDVALRIDPADANALRTRELCRR